MQQDTIPTPTVPVPYDDTWMLYVLVAILAMFIVAYWVEKLRRRAEWRRTLEAEFASLGDLARDKDCTREEQTILEDLARRFAPEEPFRVGTMRQVFNRCVDAAMDEALKSGDKKLFERRGAILRDIRVKLGQDYVPFGLRIQSTRELYHKQPMWVSTAPDLDHAQWTRMVVAQVDEGHFYLAHEDDIPLPAVRPGDTIHIRMWREEDARYEFNARLVSTQPSAPEWELAHAVRLRRLQARAHFRIKHDAAVEVGIVNAPLDGEMAGIEARPIVTRLRGRITSLSGGGYAVMLTQPVPRQVLLRVQFDIDPAHGPLLTNARIVGSVDISGGRHLIRAQFVGMSEEGREIVTRHVFQAQQSTPGAVGPQGED